MKRARLRRIPDLAVPWYGCTVIVFPGIHLLPCSPSTGAPSGGRNPMHLKTRIASALIALAALAGLGLAAVPAGAATVPCHAIWSFRCSTPVVAQALIPANDLNPAADFALRYEGPNPSDGVAYGDLGINFSNTLGDGTEDFEWDLIGHVPTSGPGSYGFTSFDNQNYGGSAIYEVAYAPNGVDTNLCVTVSSKFRSNGLVHS